VATRAVISGEIKERRALDMVWAGVKTPVPPEEVLSTKKRESIPTFCCDI
jgi:hypothetical protein